MEYLCTPLTRAEMFRKNYTLYQQPSARDVNEHEGEENELNLRWNCPRRGFAARKNEFTINCLDRWYSRDTLVYMVWWLNAEIALCICRGSEREWYTNVSRSRICVGSRDCNGIFFIKETNIAGHKLREFRKRGRKRDVSKFKIDERFVRRRLEALWQICQRSSVCGL